MNKTLFFSVGNGPNSIYIIKMFQSLGYKIIVGDGNKDSAGKLFADKFILLPMQSDPHYFETILEIIKKEKVNYFVPFREVECLESSKIRQRFLDENCILVTPNTLTLETAIDKAHLYDFLCEKSDIPMMKYHVVDSLQSFEEGLVKLQNYSLAMKPAQGAGSRGFVILKNKPFSAKEFFTSKNEFVTLSNNAIREMLKNSEEIPKLLLMEMLEGTHYDTNMVCKDGEILYQSVKTRAEAKIGTITKGTILHHPELEEINRKIVKLLNTTGLISTQFIGNKLVEINPRWSTSLVVDGINEYLMDLQVWANEKIQIDPKVNKEYIDTQMLRFWDLKVFKDKDL